MTANPVSERLAAIRDRHQTYVDRHSHTSFACCSAHPPADDVPDLLDALEAVLAAKPSMHADHGPIPDECRFCAGEAAGLLKVRELIANHLIYGTEEATDA